MTQPVLTGESRADAELWRLSFVLAEIAEQAVRSENDVSASTEKKRGRKSSMEKLFL